MDGRPHVTGTAISRIEDEAGDRENDPFAEIADDFYEARFCDLIHIYAEDMWFPEQWAHELGVSEHVMLTWVTRFPEFARAYARALTALRATFTTELVHVARGGTGTDLSNPALYQLLAKTRFRDLFGDNPPSLPVSPASVRDITPGAEGAPAAGMNEARIMGELEVLRKRHAR
jgi:hypothetical protein